MPERPFVKDASFVVLAAFVIIEVASIFGVSPSSASIFVYPLNLAISSLLILTSIFGVYGVLADNRIAAFFCLSTPAVEMVLGIPFLVGALSQSNVKSVVILNGLLVTLLGLVGVFLFARTSRQSSLGLLETNAVEQRSQSEMNGYSVEVIDVTKSYVVGPVVVPAVNGLTMKVRRGEFVAVMGPSGCGKSTLLNLIGALDRPTSGQVLIDGTNISKLSAHALAQLRNEKVGFVFQAYNLINRSNVLRNVELPMLVRGDAKDHRSTRTREMLNVVGLDSMESRKPKTMSGGEQQRVAIARALVNNPKIVLADEPTGNLDSKAGMEILSFLKSTNKELNTTVIIVTHNREAAEMADRIIYLRDGRIEKEERLRSEFK